jgi:site-specific recombinase XerC
LTLDHLQQREEHWAIVDLAGRGGHVRTVPVADWVRNELHEWLAAAELVLGSATPLGASWNRFSSSWVTFRFRPLNAISAVSREFDPRSMIESVSSRLLRLDKTFRKACRQVAK